MNAPCEPGLIESAPAARPPDSWTESLAAYHELATSDDARASMVLEAVLEELYVQACHAGPARLVELVALLASPVGPLSSAWRNLCRLALRYDPLTLDELDATLAVVPARSAWLIGAEAARLTYLHVGVHAAWARVRSLTPPPAEEAWLNDGPLVIHAHLLALRLAAASGHWDEHAALVASACAGFGAADDPRAVRIRLACAEHDLARGHYQPAARALDELAPHCRGDLRLQLLCVRLHALVACAGPQRDTGLRAHIEATLAELAEARAASTSDADKLPDDERAALLQRADQLMIHAGVDDDPIEPHQVESLAAALAVELQARRGHGAAPAHEVFAALLPRVEALLLRADATDHHESWLRLRLLWCRLLVDLEIVERYDECEFQLTSIIDDTTAAGMLPLAMAAYDQRAVLRAHPALDAWAEALDDAGQAGDLAVRLLAENSSHGGGERVMERALLGMLAPVLDRVVDLLVHSALEQRPSDSDARASWAPDLAERWSRFGQATHDYVEQSQALALQEARYAYGSEATIPHRFALAAPGQALESPLPRLRAALRPRDAVLQYFVTGRFVLIFYYSRAHFDWELVDAVALVEATGGRLDTPTAHAALLHLLDDCDPWLKGEPARAHRDAVDRLRRAVLPTFIGSRLDRARRAHVRIVPHDVLYRVPFGRLEWGARTLQQRASMSIHPTAAIAAESALRPLRPLRPRGQRTLGYLLGPELGHAGREHEAIRDSLGRRLPLARVHQVDSTRARSTDDVVTDIEPLDILHIACHGGRPRGRREAYIKLGTGRLRLSEVASLHLRQCALVVLQSCWTGWMEHERRDPVQGFPQALCDAGVGAVIAPLVKVPDSLTPMFAQVFYRILRFATAERALPMTLAVVRDHGPALVGEDPDARRDLRELGSLDVREYRYVGRTDLALCGGPLSRLVGRLSFWRWLRGIQRRSRRTRAQERQRRPAILAVADRVLARLRGLANRGGDGVVERRDPDMAGRRGRSPQDLEQMVGEETVTKAR